MKTQTKQEMLASFNVTDQEANAAIELFRVLRPAITVKRENGRIETTHGDKSILGFYRTVKDIINKEKEELSLILKASDFERINNDSNGNPRYVIHFLRCLPKSWNNEKFRYENVCKLMNKIGGKKFNNKSYAGGIVFQSYSLPETIKAIERLIASIDKY